MQTFMETTDLLLGIEIGGTKLQIASGHPDGTIKKIIKGKVSPQDGYQGVLEWLEQNVPPFLNCFVKRIGVGFGGPIETKTGRILGSLQVNGWENFNLAEWLELKFGLPASVYNDSNAAGWGEYCMGAGRGVSNFFYTNIGSGIGGAAILGGVLYDGSGYGAGELGQVYIPAWDGAEYGREKRVESLCSGWAIDRRLREIVTVPEQSILMKLCAGDRTLLNAKLLGDAVKLGDPFSISELDRIANGFSIALSSVISLLSPQRIAIGGGVSLIGEPLIERIRKYTEDHDFISGRGGYEIVACELGESIVLHGAILLAAQD